MLYVSRWKTVLIWLAVLVSTLVALPNVFSEEQLRSLPSWLPHKQVTLGLDLQGGSHIMLKIERADIVKERLETTVSDIRAALRDAGIRYTGLSGVGQQIQVRITDADKVEAAKKALENITAPVSVGGLTGGSVQEVTLTEEGTLLRFN